jgi:hypothetical protein
VAIHGSRVRADMLWREPEGVELPVLPDEWTPLADFLRAWADQYADRLVRRHGFAHGPARFRSYLARRAYAWCLVHVIEHAEVELSTRIEGELQPITIMHGSKYQTRHGELVRVARNVVGRSVRDRDPVIDEVYADPHVRRRPEVTGTVAIAPAAARARMTKAKIEDARKKIEAIQSDRQQRRKDFADLPELMVETGLTKRLLEKALQQVSPTLKRKPGQHRKPRK